MCEWEKRKPFNTMLGATYLLVATYPLLIVATYPLLRLGVEPRIRASKAHVLTTYTNRAHPHWDLNPESFD